MMSENRTHYKNQADPDSHVDINDEVPYEDQFREHAFGLPAPDLREHFTREMTLWPIWEEVIERNGKNSQKRVNGPIYSRLDVLYVQDPNDPPILPATVPKNNNDPWDEGRLHQSNSAGPPDAHDVVRLSLPDLTRSDSDDTDDSPPLRSPEETHELPFSLNASDVAKRSLLEPVRLTSNKTAASSLPRSLEEPNESHVRFDASDLTQPNSLEPAPLNRGGTAASTPAKSTDESELTFVYQHKHKLNAKVDPKTRGYDERYHRHQRVFESALAEIPVSETDRAEFTTLFKWNTHGQLMRVEQGNFKPATEIARRSPTWQREHTLMNALWQAICYREKTGLWYARLHVRDKRNAGQAGHKHIIDVLKAAWRILNDGIEYDPASPPT